MSRKIPAPVTARQIAESIMAKAAAFELLAGGADSRVTLARGYLAAESAREQAEARAREAEADADRLAMELKAACFEIKRLCAMRQPPVAPFEAAIAAHAARRGGPTNG